VNDIIMSDVLHGIGLGESTSSVLSSLPITTNCSDTLGSEICDS
jgi:hypothetical protein